MPGSRADPPAAGVTEATLSAGALAPAAASSPRLRAAVARERRRQSRRGLLLVAPMLAFTLLLFGYPLARMVWRSVASPEMAEVLPDLQREILGWNGNGLPPDAVFAAAARDLRAAGRAHDVAGLAARLNDREVGTRSLLMRSAERLARMPSAPAAADARAALTALDPRWGQAKTWQFIRSVAPPLTPFYLLAALDLRWTPDGRILAADRDHAIFRAVLLRTFWMASVVTAITLALGFPVAHLLATVSPRWRNLLMIPVLLPFWTSLLVRVCAWIVLLQKEGIVNNALLSLRLIEQPLQLVFNRTGVYVAMVHVLLPFMILPLYSVMQGIAPTYMRAAASLGAPPARAFVTAYLPQALPGVGAGCTLVFIIAIGYYITPALIGGPRDQMISYFIAFFTNQTVNWGMASALAVVLLVATALLYAVYQRLAGVEGPRFG